jgi:hypothetical protein
MTARSETPSDRADDGSQAREEGADRPEESARPLSKDTIFELLKNQRRRYVLRYLADDPGPARLRDLAERIAAWENDKPIGALSSDERKRVYVGLYQCHLTKMDDAGVVAFNQDRGLVTLGERASELYEYLDPDRENEGSWSLAYLAFAAVSAVLALLVEAGFPASILPGAAVTGVVVVGFALLALVHAATVSVLDVGTPMAAIDAVTGALADTDRS